MDRQKSPERLIKLFVFTLGNFNLNLFDLNKKTTTETSIVFISQNNSGVTLSNTENNENNANDSIPIPNKKERPSNSSF